MPGHEKDWLTGGRPPEDPNSDLVHLIGSIVIAIILAGGLAFAVLTALQK